MTLHRLAGPSLTHCLLASLILLVASCGSDSPTTPTPPGGGGGLTAPTLSSPADDGATTGRPTLVVNNVTSSQSGARTYDFQVADNAAALGGPDSGLLAS